MMVRYLITVASLILAPTPALAEKLFLSCTMVDTPDIAVRDLYTTVPKTQKEFTQDVWEQGAAGAILGPPMTWAIDTDTGEISSPEGNASYTQTLESEAVIEGRFRTDSGTLKTFRFNRIDRSLGTSIHYAPHSLDEWKVKHGKTFPLDWNWRQTCKAVAPM